jgi:hypothetical protein
MFTDVSEVFAAFIIALMMAASASRHQQTPIRLQCAKTQKTAIFTINFSQVTSRCKQNGILEKQKYPTTQCCSIFKIKQSQS